MIEFVSLHKKHTTIESLRIVEQPRHLRHFTTHLDEID